MVRGRASRVSETNNVGGGGSSGSLAVHTTHIVTFSLGACAVLISQDEPPVIREGDDMVVAGEKNAAGVLKPIAYVNVTRGVSSSTGGPFLWLAGGGIVIGLGCFSLALDLMWMVLMALGADMKMGNLPPYLIVFIIGVVVGLGLIAFGRCLWGRGSRIRKALRMIRDASVRNA